MTVFLDLSAGSVRTFRDLQDEALADDFNPAKHRANAQRFISEALRRIARRVRIPELEGVQEFSTVAGTDIYALDVLVVRVNSLRNTTDRDPLTAVAIEELDDYPAASGKPSAYAHVGQSIVLSPTPDAAYSLAARFQSRPGGFANDLDPAQISDDYADLLVTFARSRLYRLEDDIEMSRALMEDFERELTQYAGDVQHQDRSRVRQVPGMFARPTRSGVVRP